MAVSIAARSALGIAVVLLSAVLSAQDPRGQIAQGDTPATLSGGIVTDHHGAVPGATVAIMDVGNSSVRSVRTDALGVFTFAKVPPGQYAFRVMKAGFLPITTSVTLLGGDDRDLGQMILRDRGPATLSGSLTYRGGVVPGATVEIMDVTNGSVQSLRTDAAGMFTFLKVPAGRYAFEVKKEGFFPITTNVALIGAESRDLGELILVGRLH